jgi:hypothetical protein
MTDLQCPARFLVVTEGTEPPDPDRHRLAAVHDLRPLTLDDVTEGRPAARVLLGDLSDLHRGETVLVRVEGPPCSQVEVSVDDDGFVLGPVNGASPGGLD